MTDTEVNNKLIENKDNKSENEDFDLDKYKIINEKIVIDANGKEKHIVYVSKIKSEEEKLREKEAQQKYYEKNKDKVIKKHSEYEKERYQIDEEFRLRRNKQNRESYQRRKAQKKVCNHK